MAIRHRAGVGISEVTDSLTVIVSEENGKISVAYEGELYRNLDADALKAHMEKILNGDAEEAAKGRHKRKGRSRVKK